MKKITYLIINFVLLMTWNSKAQKTSFGITTGPVFPSYKVKIESIAITSDIKVGFTAGVMSSIAMGKSFSFQPGLNFIQKGGTYEEEGTTDKTTLNYLELPFNFVYHTNSAKGKFFAGAGPSLSYGISGKDEWDDGYYQETTEIKFGSEDDDDLKQLEIGINVLAGYQLKNGLFFAANYNMGINNIMSESFEDYKTSYHNRYFAIRIGYLFGKK